MASEDLRAELECPICLNMYADPVMLKCGHNFCRVCIDQAFDALDCSGGYSCPQCRETFQERPSPQGNRTLRNITQRLLSPQPAQEKTGIFCTYCIHTSVAAVKSCLLCEASLCHSHLKVHSRSPEHVLCDPTAAPEGMKCPVHKKVLEYCCTEDSALICVSCSLTGEHWGHQVETLQEALVKTKKRLINNLKELINKREKTEERVRGLKQRRGKVEEEAEDEKRKVTSLFEGLRRLLADLEERVLREISGRAERHYSPIDNLIQDLEMKKDQLVLKMSHIEEMCNMKDPLTLLQEPDKGDLRDTEDGDEDRASLYEAFNDGGGLDVSGISETLRTGLSDLITGVCGGIYVRKAEGMTLDVDTAHEYVCISSDGRTASKPGGPQHHPWSTERFTEFYQVLGDRSFSSGRHYWELDVGRSNNWRIGLCYPSMDLDGDDSLIGSNDVSWGLDRKGRRYHLVHDNNDIDLPDDIHITRARVYLDYEAGQISFYTCNPVQHLHTYSATFTEPLQAVLGVWHASISLV